MKYALLVFICFMGFVCAVYYYFLNNYELQVLYILFAFMAIVLMYLTRLLMYQERIEDKIDTLLDKDKK